MFQTPLWKQRHELVAEIVRSFTESQTGAGTFSVFDAGCGAGGLLQILIRNTAITKLLGVDLRETEIKAAARNCAPTDWEKVSLRENPLVVSLFQGSICDYDYRIAQCDVVTCIEVIEHLPPENIPSFAATIFGQYQPKICIITTPNAEFNVCFESLRGGKYRDEDHKFEWTRQEFQNWSRSCAKAYGYEVTFSGVGNVSQLQVIPSKIEEFGDIGLCTQMAIFTKCTQKVSMCTSEQLLKLVETIKYSCHEGAPSSAEEIQKEVSKQLPHFAFNDVCLQVMPRVVVGTTDVEFNRMLLNNWPSQGQYKILLSRLWGNLRIQQICKSRQVLQNALLESQKTFRISVDSEAPIVTALQPIPIPKYLRRLSREGTRHLLQRR